MAVEPYPWARLPVALPQERHVAAWVAALGGARWHGTAAACAVVDPVIVTVRVGAARAGLALPGRLAAAIADRALGRAPGLAAPRPPTAVEAALAAFAVATVIERVGALATAEVGGAIAGPVVEVALTAPIACVIAVAVEDAPPPPPPRALADALAWGDRRLPPLVATVVAARAEVAAARLAALAPRDVVVLGGTGGLAIARGWFPAVLDPGRGRLTVTGPYERAPMTDPRELFLDDVRVPLTIVAGEVELSARELLGLAPGQVLTLPAPVGGPVELRAGGRVIGRGELVVVDGDLGVRVIDVLSPPPAP